jgi:hypothetical protein
MLILAALERTHCDQVLNSSDRRIFSTDTKGLGIGILRLARQLSFLLGATLLVLGLSVLTRAQDTVTGAFEGTVTNDQGAALKGADIQIKNELTAVTYNLKSDFRGHFYQGLLSPGDYLVTVSYPGYQTKAVHQELKITYPGEVVPIPVSLDPAPPPTATAAATPTPPPPLAAEDTAIRASINRIDGRRSGSFNKEQVSTLPLGGVTHTRTFDELALLLPGVAPPPEYCCDVVKERSILVRSRRFSASISSLVRRTVIAT